MKKNLMFITVLCLLMFSFAAGLQAKPPKEKLEVFKKEFSRKIKVRLIRDDLMEAIDLFRKESELPMIIDFPEIEKRKEVRITLTAESITIERYLDWICKMADIDYDVRDGMLFITSIKEATSPYIMMKVYDIRGMTIEPQDMPGPNIELVSGEADIAISSFSDSDSALDADGVKELIEGTVYPQIWSGEDERIGIDVSRGLLFVNAPIWAHEKIQELLSDQREKKGRMVSIEARYFTVSPEDLDAFLKKRGSNSLVLTPEEVDTFLKLSEKEPERYECIGTNRLLCFNTQRSHSMAVSQNSYIRDVTPVVATMQASVDPEIDTWTEGAVLDARPTISWDSKWILLEARTTMVKPGNHRKAYVPVGTFTPSAETFATEDSSVTMEERENGGEEEEAKEYDADIPGTGGIIKKRPAQHPTSTPIDQPSVEVIRVRSNARVPDGGGVLFTNGSKSLKVSGKKYKEVITLIRATISR